MLLLAQHERLSGNQIAAQMPLSRPAISHHLTVRLQGGPVQMERVSRKNVYSLPVDHVLRAMRTLVEPGETVCI